MVVYGHTPVPEPEWINNTLCVDTGCVFGGSLTALRYPSREIVSVPAATVYYEPARPLQPATTERGDGLSVADVTGRRSIDTGYGRVTVAAENAAAALEVMGRFAIAPEDLLWLPPTMAPCSTSTVDGYLEHPSSALADYRSAGIDTVVLQEKHMGSRAVILVRRDGSGACYTRTGRAFFADDQLNRALLRRVATAAGPLFDELDSDWVLLDTELLPWSAKAAGLIREQYASVGAAARTALPAGLAVLTAVADRGLAVEGLTARLTDRLANATAFTEVYRRYCWSTAGLDGVRLAPFAVLASARAHHLGRDQGWQLAQIDRLVAADPELFQATRRLVVDLAAGDEAAVEWWLELTAAGGEGMVVKPWTGLARSGDQLSAREEPSASEAPQLARGSRRFVQPGIKCRGREYLRIIYGPDYTAPERLERLRGRNLGRKRSLAHQEHILGLAALDRLVAGQPLWRVHEPVFAILALESEPVDPRL
jgi:polynucleotide kinase-phosphatase